MMLDKTTWEDSESWVTPLSYHFTHSSRLTFFLFHHSYWLRDCVTASLQECFRHVIRYARAAYPGWFRGSWLGEPWFPLRVLLLPSHVFLYGDVFVSLLCFWLFISRHTDDSAMMLKTSLFSDWAGPVHNAGFAFLCVLFVVWRVVFFCFCFLSCSVFWFSALWLPSRTV